MLTGPVELAFARVLASNDRKIRAQAVKKLSLWLSSRGNGEEIKCKIYTCHVRRICVFTCVHIR